MNEFNRGQVSGQHIDYLFYVEGVLVPIQSFALTVQVDQPANLVVMVAPFPEGITNLKRNMRVHLFKRMNKEEKPRLRFSGIITGHMYNKSFGQRTLQITCASANYKWQTLLSSNMDDKNFNGASETILNTYKTNLSNGTYDNAVTDAKAKLDAAQKSGNSEEISKAQQELKIAENNRIAASGQIKNQSEASTGLTSAAVTPIYTRGGDVSVTRSNLETLSSNIKDSGKTTSARSAISAVTKDRTPQNFSLVTAFEKALETHGHNFMKALFAVMQDAYLKSDPCTVRDYLAFRDDILPAYLEIFDPTIKPTNSTDTENDPSLYAFVKREFKKALKGTAAGSPFIVALLSVLDSMFLKFSVDPLAMSGQVVFHPMMASFVPPKCNVVFPNMYNEINFNINDWQEPTRSFVIFPPFVGGDLQAYSREQQDAETRSQDLIARTLGILCDSADPFIQKAKVEPPTQKTGTGQADAGVVKLDQAAKEMEKVMDIVTNEEQEIGVSLNVVHLPHTFMTNMELSDKIKFANFMHGIARYSMRQCSVLGCIVDDLAVGMPILILDGLYSIHGTLEAMQYSVTADGSMGCSLTIGYPKFILLDEQLQASPLWLKDIDKMGSVLEIGRPGRGEGVRCRQRAGVDYGENLRSMARSCSRSRRT